MKILTNKEIDNAVTWDLTNENLKQFRNVASAQHQAIGKWGLEICPHTHSNLGLDDYVATKRECPKCWSGRFKEVK